MTTLYLDRGTEQERSLEIDSFFESPMKNRFSASRRIIVEDGAGYPDLEAFRDTESFETIHVISESGEIPLTGTYNMVEDINVNYSDVEKTYFVNLSIKEKEGDVTNGG